MRVLLMMLLLAPAAAPAQSCPGAPGKAPWAKPDERRFLVPVFPRVKVTKDLAFAEVVNDLGQKETLRLDLYEPEGDAAPLRPAILWLHGGSFQPTYTKEQEGLVALARHFAQLGYVSVSLEYRARHNEGRALRLAIIDGMNDVMAGLAWVRRHAKDYRIDAGFVGIAGTSAGGMLSGTFTSRKDLDAAPRDRAGLFAQGLFWGQPHHPSLPELRPDIDSCYPPTVFLIGNEDLQTPFTSALAMAQDMDRAGVKRRVQIVEGGGHSLEGRHGEFVPMAARFFYEMLTGHHPSVYQAEQYSKMLGGEFRPAQGASAGTGCLEFSSQAGYVEWDYVGAAPEGWHTLRLRYANRSASARGGEVRVNGASAGKLLFDPAADTAWKTATLRVMLRSGVNTVRVTAGPGDGPLKLDEMTVSGER